MLSRRACSSSQGERRKDLIGGKIGTGVLGGPLSPRPSRSASACMAVWSTSISTWFAPAPKPSCTTGYKAVIARFKTPPKRYAVIDLPILSE